MGRGMEVRSDGEGKADEVEECGDRMDDEDGGEGMASAGGEVEVAIGVVVAEQAIC